MPLRNVSFSNAIMLANSNPRNVRWRFKRHLIQINVGPPIILFLVKVNMARKLFLQEFQLRDFQSLQQLKHYQMSLEMPNDKQLEINKQFLMYLEMLSPMVSDLETDLEMVFWMDLDAMIRIRIRGALPRKQKLKKQMKTIDLSSKKRIGK